MIHAEVLHGETLGRSDGTPGQRFALQRRPVLAADHPGYGWDENKGYSTAAHVEALPSGVAAADIFLANHARYATGEPLHNER